MDSLYSKPKSDWALPYGMSVALVYGQFKMISIVEKGNFFSVFFSFFFGNGKINGIAVGFVYSSEFYVS